MIGSLHVEGRTWMHALSPRTKIAGLAAVSVVLFLLSSPLLLACTSIAAAIPYFRLGMPWREAVRRLRPVLLTIFVVAAFAFIFRPLPEAGAALFRLTTLLFLASIVTATTTVSQFVDVITAFAAPLERLGLARAADIGLAVGLVVRFAPAIMERYAGIREAHVARGLRVRPLTLLVPLVILTLRDADTIAAAIDARGFRHP